MQRNNATGYFSTNNSDSPTETQRKQSFFLHVTEVLALRAALKEDTEPCGTYYGTIARRATLCSCSPHGKNLSVTSVPLWAKFGQVSNSVIAVRR